MSQVMELSKEVHGLLDRIKRLSNAQNTSTKYEPYRSDSINRMHNTLEEVDFSLDEIIPLENFDTSDRETWLFSPTESQILSTVEINDKSSNNSNTLQDFDKYNKKLDTRTFTRPKKRLNRPRLGDISDYETDKSTNNITDLESIKIPENPFNSFSTRNDVSISTGPLHFKLSDPVMNHSFDKILLSSSDRYDSFQNMSPPSLMNSLCSSTFNTLLDSGCAQSNSVVPNDNIYESNNYSTPMTELEMKDSVDGIKNLDVINDSNRLESSCSSSIISTDKLNKLLNSDTSNDLNLTYKPSSKKSFIRSPMNKTYDKNNDSGFENKSTTELNTTFNKNAESKNINTTYQTINKTKNSKLNSTYSALNKTNSIEKLNLSYSNYNKMNTFIKKPRNITNVPDSLKKSCPDINQTYQPISYEKNLNRTIKKLSDSQPNLAKDVQQTILNQSYELLSTTTCDDYHNLKSGSTDSLDEQSSSISNSSKESGSKILNMGDLDNLAKMQERSLQQIMSTPKPKSTVSKMWDCEQISPIHKQEEYLSEDSDMSDLCLTARSRTSQQSSSPISSRSDSLTRLNGPTKKSDITRLLQPQGRVKQEVSQSNVRNLPTMIVKPMEVDRTFKVNEKPEHLMQPPMQVRPRVRSSGLPRPTSSVATGIPRLTSRIPGPRPSRSQLIRPTLRPTKSEWNDGCY